MKMSRKATRVEFPVSVAKLPDLAHTICGVHACIQCGGVSQIPYTTK
jgi:hypothetical protein